MVLPSRKAELALAEKRARERLDDAAKARDWHLFRRRVRDLELAGIARREG
jgi:hypothetical protein